MNANDKLYAEDVNYWKSSTSSPDTWIDKAKTEIKRVGGKVTGELVGSVDGKTAFMLMFELDSERYEIKWPVLQSKTGNERAAKIQAATALYHDVKARCVARKFLRSRATFMPFLLLPNDVTCNEASTPQLSEQLPDMFRGGLSRPALPAPASGVTVEVE